MQTAICKTATVQRYAVHADAIAISESMPLPLAAVHWGMPQQPTRDTQNAQAWHGMGRARGRGRHLSGGPKKVSLEGTTEEIPSLAPINGPEPASDVMACCSPRPVVSLPSGAGLASLASLASPPANQQPSLTGSLPPYPGDCLIEPTLLTQWKASKWVTISTKSRSHLPPLTAMARNRPNPQTRRVCHWQKFSPKATARELLPSPSRNSLRSLAEPPYLSFQLSADGGCRMEQAPPRVLHKGFFAKFDKVTSALSGVVRIPLRPQSIETAEDSHGKIRIPSATAPPWTLSIYLLAKLFGRRD